MLQDSGERTVFEGGSMREIVSGKGRLDLLPLMEIAMWEERKDNVVNGSFIKAIGEYLETLDEEYLFKALNIFIHERKWSFYEAIRELAIHYEDGAKKYDENNWRAVGGGLPTHCFLDSGLRHYVKYKEGWTDEPHDRAVIWNFISLLYTLHYIPEKDDFTFFRERKKYLENH